MNLQKIENYITQFKKQLTRRASQHSLFKWESLHNFQKNWDLENDDLAAMYNRSLQNTQTVRLWKDRQYFPKQIMLLFCEMQPDYVDFAFKDLFNEEKSIDGRVDRFIFYCDELLAAYKEKNPLKVENNHYHHYRIISLYLCFRYPEQYTLYNFDVFKKTMQNLGSRAIPKINDIERYFKICRTLWKFLEKDEQVWALHQRRINPSIHYTEKSLLLVEEFCEMIANSRD